ncbi:MAG TPA: SAM-dependent methyltransferase [Chloroflexia bacterium]|nr:SAM-dependent methyltransferase [Chloroflexia bacterium]
MPEYIMMMMPSQSGGELLAGYIRREIETHGPVTVARFIEWALYHPQYGYYTRGPNIGPKGDFLTSPETSPAFSQLLAGHVAEIDALLKHPPKLHIVECGPGRGTLAADLLQALASQFPALFQRCHYWLVEISPALRAEQRQRLLPGFEGYVSWIGGMGELPSGVEGALIGNEFIDAFPVHVLENRDGEILEQYAGVGDEGEFELVYGKPSDARLTEFLSRYQIELAPGERIEINLAGAQWFNDAARVFSRGVVTLIDYGDTQPGRYSSSRREGTLLGYYGGAVTHDILAHPGEQDITALVDFTALQDDARSAGFSTVGMTRQATFLVGLGLGSSLTVEGHTNDVTAALNYRRGLQTLVSMEGLGRFHVLLLGKGVDARVAAASLSGMKYAGLL